jgi:hypothetical protein
MIVLLENNRGSTAETVRAMIEQAGLHIVFVHNCEGRRTPYTRTYYIGIARRGDTLPAWGATAEPPQYRDLVASLAGREVDRALALKAHGAQVIECARKL